jgi:phosphoglycerol transferase
MSAPATSPPGEAVADDLAAGGAGQSKLPRRSLVVDSLVTAALGAAAFVIGFGVDLRRLADPIGSMDLVQNYAAVKLWSDGTPFGNNTLGYPFGIEQRYYPTTDIFQNALAGLISALSHNPFVGINAVYALSFPLVALAALWVFRMVGVRGPMGIFTALAFTVIPFHWFRVEHIYFATMYSAVLGVGLAILIGTGSVERRLGGRRWPTIALLVFLIVVIAGSGIYYVCFTILLGTAALVYRLAHRPSWRGALVSATPLIGVMVLTGAALMPASIFVHAHPALHPVADRQVTESVRYSGNLALALVPAPVTQIPGLESLNPFIKRGVDMATTPPAPRLTEAPPYSNFGSLFTNLALALAGVGWFWSVRRRARGATSRELAADAVKPDTNVSFGLVGLLLVTTILFFVPTGLNFVFAAVVTPQIRAWNRLVPILYLLFFIAAMVAWRSMGLPQKGRRAMLISAGCLVVLVFDSILPYQANFAMVTANGQRDVRFGEQYANALNTAIPGKCAILELPYQRFPEAPNFNGLPTYYQFWPALTNPSKAWTFGAIKGTTAAKWQAVLGNNIDKSAVSNLVGGGFCGIHVDRRGFTAGENVVMTKRLSALLGVPVATGHGGDWAAYALPAARRDPAFDVKDTARLPDRLARFFYPTVLAPHDGGITAHAEIDAFGPWWRATGERTEFTVDSMEPAAEFIEVTGTLRAGDCSPRDVTLELRTANQSVTTNFRLQPGEEHDFALRMAQTTTSAQLVVTAPGALCANPDIQKVYTVALLNTDATRYLVP